MVSVWTGMGLILTVMVPVLTLGPVLALMGPVLTGMGLILSVLVTILTGMGWF
jgi:hypothetical protein